MDSGKLSVRDGVMHFLLRSEKARSGSILMWSLFVSIVGISLIYYVNSRVLDKNQTLTKERKKRRSKNLLEAIYTVVLTDIRSTVVDQKSCSLDHMIMAGAKTYTKANPKVFPKEEIFVEEFDENNQPTGRFETPETNPRAWIEKAPGANAGLYQIVVQATQCPRIVVPRNYLKMATDPAWSAMSADEIAGMKIAQLLGTARVPPEDPRDPPLEIAWKDACNLMHGETLKAIEYRAFFDTQSLAAEYYIYFDRSRFTNTAFWEPAYADDFDLESRVTPQQIAGDPSAGDGPFTAVETEPSKPKDLYRFSGSTHEPSNMDRCSVRTRDIVTNAIESILALDPCAKISTYVVAGVGAPASPNHNIRCVGGGGRCSGGKYTKPISLSQEKATILADVLGTPTVSIGGDSGICAIQPAGVSSLETIMAHYGEKHQPSYENVPDAERGMRRVLMVVGSGLEMGADHTLPSQEPTNLGGNGGATNLAAIRYMDVFSTTNCGEGGGRYYIETNGVGTAQFNNTVIAAGTSLYKPGGGPPVSGQKRNFRRRIPPAPHGSTTIRSVHRMEDGTCIDILKEESGLDVYDVANYPYYLRHPLSVVSAAGNLIEALKKYNPVDKHRKKVLDKARALVNLDLRNAFVYFPMPIVDLDELRILDPTVPASRRPLMFQFLRGDDVTSSYTSILRGFEGNDYMFNEGTKVFGINAEPAR